MRGRPTRQTARRAYWVHRCGELWQVSYQPVNAKTGKPWQAQRTLHAPCLAVRYKDGRTVIVKAESPSFKDWGTVYPGYQSAYRGFDTESEALAAMLADE